MSTRELIAIVATVLGLGAVVGGLIAVNNSGDDTAATTTTSTLRTAEPEVTITTTTVDIATTTSPSVATTAPTTAPTSTTTPGVFTSIFEVEVGQCFNNPGDGELSGIVVVPCAAPHDNEIYALFDIEGEELPPQQEMLEGCLDRFDAAIGIPYADSIYDFGGYTPGPAGFADGDREVICYAFTYTGNPDVAGEQIVGTVIGSGR